MRQPTDSVAHELLARLAPDRPEFASRAVETLLAEAQRRGASDVHLQPSAGGLEVRFRIDGVLQPVVTFPAEVAVNVVSRLKVLAELLTYRSDVAQEGRLRSDSGDAQMRVSTFPTLHGERAVVRLFPPASQYRRLADLGFPEDVAGSLGQLLDERSGAIVVTGPAGSGKTTTVYACLREIAAASAGARSLVSIEDPIEVPLEGGAQSRVNPSVGWDLATGLRFLMRQDPEVILVGEIRDPETAEAAMQASLTGHLLLSTFHAGSAAEAIGRLLDMGIEPYLLRSGLLAILSQRLVRRLCACAQPTDAVEARLGLPVESVRLPVGCDRCAGTGYLGRFVLVEMLRPQRSEMGRAILSRSDSTTIEQLAVASGMVTRWQRALEALRAGRTSPAEIRRVLGVGTPPAGFPSDSQRMDL